MLAKEMKSIIKYVIELDIDYLETFLGYEGDTVLKVISRNEKSVKLIEEYIKNMGLAYKSEYDKSGEHVKSHNIFVGVEDPSVYKLKRDTNNN